MANYLIINLAEETGAGTGVTAKVRDALLERGKKTERYGFLWKNSRVIQQHTIQKFDLADDFDTARAGEGYGFDRQALNDIRRQVSNADAVYYCAHGKAPDRDNVFTQRGTIGASRPVLLCTVAQFADFARMILPADKTHDLRLIVCFAARSSSTETVHTRNFLRSSRGGHQALKSSLAYKFYKRLDEAGVRTKMFARLGEVQVSMSSEFAMDVLTQTEDGVLATMGLGEASDREQHLGAHLSESRRAELRMFVSMGTPELGPDTDEEEQWVDAYREFTRLNQLKDDRATSTGSGRLLYERSGSQLKISFEDTQVYKGAFF